MVEQTHEQEEKKSPREEEQEEQDYEKPEYTPIDQLFTKLSEGVTTDEIVSLCMECNENGVTRFMYTKIPMFKEIILSSFTCDHCGNKNTEV